MTIWPYSTTMSLNVCSLLHGETCSVFGATQMVKNIATCGKYSHEILPLIPHLIRRSLHLEVILKSSQMDRNECLLLKANGSNNVSKDLRFSDFEKWYLSPSVLPILGSGVKVGSVHIWSLAHHLYSTSLLYHNIRPAVETGDRFHWDDIKQSPSFSLICF